MLGIFGVPKFATLRQEFGNWLAVEAPLRKSDTPILR